MARNRRESLIQAGGISAAALLTAASIVGGYTLYEKTQAPHYQWVTMKNLVQNGRNEIGKHVAIKNAYLAYVGTNGPIVETPRLTIPKTTITLWNFPPVLQETKTYAIYQNARMQSAPIYGYQTSEVPYSSPKQVVPLPTYHGNVQLRGIIETSVLSSAPPYFLQIDQIGAVTK